MSKKPRKYQQSFMAEAVARKVIEKVQKGEPINLKEIQIKQGYSVASANSYAVQRVKSYQETINRAVDRMNGLRSKVLTALEDRNMSKEKMFDLNNLLKTINHDTQLLSGKSTENVAHKNNVVVYGSDDFLQMQLRNNESKLLDNSSNV